MLSWVPWCFPEPLSPALTAQPGDASPTSSLSEAGSGGGVQGSPPEDCHSGRGRVLEQTSWSEHGWWVTLVHLGPTPSGLGEPVCYEPSGRSKGQLTFSEECTHWKPLPGIRAKGARVALCPGVARREAELQLLQPLTKGGVCHPLHRASRPEQSREGGLEKVGDQRGSCPSPLLAVHIPLPPLWDSTSS